MLTKVSFLLKNQCKTVKTFSKNNKPHYSHSAQTESENRNRGRKKITPEFINNAQTLQEMVVGVNIEKFT